MIDVIGVLLDSVKSIHYYLPQDLSLKKGQTVIVDTDHGIQIGNTITSIYQRKKRKTLVLPLRKVIRIANSEDLAKSSKLKSESDEALKVAKNMLKS